jgi:hypothetical protein
MDFRDIQRRDTNMFVCNIVMCSNTMREHQTHKRPFKPFQNESQGRNFLNKCC